jgi:hypothetical protein
VARMTEDEAKTVAALAAQCVWGGRDRWGLIMRYGQLFTPGTEAGSGPGPLRPSYAGRNAYQMAMDSGLLYAEGFACPRGGVPAHWAWCLDGETVVDPGSSEPGTAYFGVALRSDYMRRTHEAQRFEDGTDGFLRVFALARFYDAVEPPVDPAADIVWDLGRDIPSWVRDWALTAQPPPAGDPVAPAWVLNELLRFPDVRASRPAALSLVASAGERPPDSGAGPEGQDSEPAAAPLPMSYARYLIRRADWFDSGMALSCSGRTGGVSSDDGTILEEIRDGDGLDTVIRIADEHRLRCEWAVCPGDEREHPELTVDKQAEVHLRWRSGRQANRDFAVLHRLDYKVWDAWLHPSHMEELRVVAAPSVLLTRNGVSYEMALAAIFQAMGDEMPEEFGVLSIVSEDRPEPGPPLA